MRAPPPDSCPRPASPPGRAPGHVGILLEMARTVGLSQADIARHLGITPIQVTRWVHGTRPVPAKHRQRLAALVFTTIHALLADMGHALVCYHRDT